MEEERCKILRERDGEKMCKCQYTALANIITTLVSPADKSGFKSVISIFCRSVTEGNVHNDMKKPRLTKSAPLESYSAVKRNF